ncbi:YihY/virulence factor BrkB family protein [Lichenicoccus sp.]|uniref:YihY/virulence factor BrkB family protein n=1 Tax=Lichenicoccus sp. TaxID=2781899 RepID=UPI003D0DC49C
MSVTLLALLGLLARIQPPSVKGDNTADAGDGHHAAAATPRHQAGYGAQTPLGIPPKGWWQIARRVFSQISADRVLAEGASVTFYTLLAIFPALATLVSLYGLIANPKTISDQLSALSGVLPGGGMQILREQIASLTSKPSTGLGLRAVIGLLTSIWSANAGMKSLFDALNVVYDEKEKRSFIVLTALTLAFTLGAVLFLIAALTGVVVLPAVLGFLGLGSTANTLLSLARWPVLLIVLSLFLAMVYRYGPSRAQPRWSWVSWGSVGATVLWLLVSVGFSYYVQNFGSYNRTYGSLGAAVGFMTWMWLSASVILIGAELNAELEHQTGRDTTVGDEQPPGQRGAQKADAIAAA